MERRKEINIKKFMNRALSYIVLFFSIFAVCYSTKQIINYINIKNENEALELKLQELKENNDKLKNTNDKLKDKDYFSIYVKDTYQYSPNNGSIIPNE